MQEFEHECLWNGPSWPYATSQTLTALGNLLCNYNQEIMKKTDYYNLLDLYANCHYLIKDGKKVQFIDEDLDPFTGEWLARKYLIEKPYDDQPKDRGIQYNHSTFCDLVLTGLAGIRSNDTDVLIINPLFNSADIDYFCADGIKYHGNFITIIWDKNGDRYNIGKGFTVLLNGEKIYYSDIPTKFKSSHKLCVNSFR